MWHRFWNFINENKSSFWLISSYKLFHCFKLSTELIRSSLVVCGALDWSRVLKPKSCILHRRLNVKTFYKHLHKQKLVYKMTPKASSLSASICLSIFQVLRYHSSFSSPCFPGHPAWAEKSHRDSHKKDCSHSASREVGKPLSYSPCSSHLFQLLWMRSPAALGPCSAPRSLR